MIKWLTEEEQYEKVLNNEEISRIRDPKLRAIRMNHWEYRHKIFLDEHNISDQELCRLTEIDFEKEKQEIEEYKKNLS